MEWVGLGRCKCVRLLAAILLTLMIIPALSGCKGTMNFSDADMDVYEKIHKRYNEMESYSAQVRLTVKSNKTEKTYLLRQYAKEPGKYRTEILEPESMKGLVTVQNGESVKLTKPDTDKVITAPAEEELDYTFVNNFFKLYYKSEETAIDVVAGADGGASGTTLLETELMPAEAHRKKATMLIDNKSLKPKNITVYDMGGNINMIAEFSDFVYNDNCKDEIFRIEG